MQVGAEFQRQKPKSLQSKFKVKVGEHCKDGAVVFIFVSGLQYPFEVSELALVRWKLLHFHWVTDTEYNGINIIMA